MIGYLLDTELGGQKGKMCVQSCSPLFPLPSGQSTGHGTSAKPAVDQSGRSTGFITITGERHWYKGEASDTTSCRKSL